MSQTTADPASTGRSRFASSIRRYFWLWIAYQTVKGLATTTFVWLPLLYVFLST
ncbi:MAG: hypothetical protein FD144_5496 [Rhodospirillaceae bacterium]|nr:MAG: hypothetical protein FD144_5496 [Rhodospirillaceae bacterium]